MKFPPDSDYKDVLALPMEGDLDMDSLDEAGLDVLLDQVCRILPDLSDSNQQGHFPLVSPEELEDRIKVIRAFNRHLVPKMRQGENRRLQTSLTLVMDNCHSLVLQSLAAAAHSSARGDAAAAASAIRIPQVILNSLRTLTMTPNGESERRLFVPKMCMTMLVPIFQHCLDCSSRPAASAANSVPLEYQRSLREVFEESKHIMGALEIELRGEKQKSRVICDEETEDLTDTMHLLAELVKILPRLDSRYFGRMARLFLDLSKSNRLTLTQDKMASKPAEILDVTAALVVEHSATVKRLSSAIIGRNSSDATVRKLENQVNKLHFLLGLLKDLADLFCDQLTGSDFALITRGLAMTLSFNDASLEFSTGIPNEVRHKITAGLTCLTKEAVEELMIDQSFSGYLFGAGLKQLMAEPKSDEWNSYEMCHLLAYMIHRVPHKNDGTRKMWMNDQDHNLLSTLFLFAGDCDEFNLAPFVIGVEHSGRGVQAVSAYEHVLTLIQSFIMGANPREMELVEFALLKSILTTESIWLEKLCSDLWSFIGRYGPPDYCCEHVMKLFGILLEIPSTDKAWMRTSRIARRMSSLLSESGAKELQDLLSGFEENPKVALALSAADSNCFNDGFKSKVLDFCLCKLRSFSEGESLDFATEAMTILVQLKPNLREESAEDIWNIVTDIWLKMSSRTYVASTNKWCIQLFAQLSRLTALLLPDRSTEEAERVLSSAWSTVVNSALDPTLCLIFTESFLTSNLEVRLKDESSVWKMLLPSAGSDALLELSCLRTLRDLNGRTQGILNETTKNLGDALANKVRKTLENSSTRSSVLESEVDLGYVQKSLNVRISEPQNTITITTPHSEKEDSPKEIVSSDFVQPSDIQVLIQRALNQADKLERGGDAIKTKLIEVLETLNSLN